MKRLLTAFCLIGRLWGEEPAGLIIIVPDDCPLELREAAATLRPAADRPLLTLLSAEKEPLTMARADFTRMSAMERARHHLIAIGPLSSPLFADVTQRETRALDGHVFSFGHGHLAGSIGIVESERNPFLHASDIAIAPFETHLVTLSGSDPAAVVLAVAAFRDKHLLNGVIAKGPWHRPRPALLESSPLEEGFSPPNVLPSRLLDGPRIGYSRVTEETLRGIRETTDQQALESWVAKYHRPGAWEGAGADHAVRHYLNGLHRRAFGNSVAATRFQDATSAAEAARRTAAAAKLGRGEAPGTWIGKPPAIGYEKDSMVTLTIRSEGPWMLISCVTEVPP